MITIGEVAAGRRGGPAMLLVYARGLDLGEAAGFLAASDVECRAAEIPFTSTASPGRRNVYLIDYERLRKIGSRDQIERALAVLGQVDGGLTIIVHDADEAEDAWLAGDPNVVAWLTSPLDPVALLTAVRTAGKIFAMRHELQTRVEAEERSSQETELLLNIGLALGSERDITALQRLIVRKARELTNADSGSLFLIEDLESERKLRFAVAQTGPDDEGKYLGAVLPLSRASISGNVAVTGDVVRIADAYTIGEEHEYRFNPSFDKANNYRTKSVLCVPMRNHKHEVVGVIQLINRKPAFDVVLTSPDFTERIVTEFDEKDQRVLLSLASQAGIALENNQLIESIQALFEQFVRASVKAIEARDASTQGHSERVAKLTVAQAETINTIDAGELKDLKFNPDQMREMRYAALLHDFGKVAVPEYIFGKSKKLPDGRLDTIRMRFLLAMEQINSRAAQEKFELMRAGAAIDDPAVLELEAKAAATHAELAGLLASVEGANEPAVVAATVGDALAAVMQRHYRDRDTDLPLLDPTEFEYLQIPRGSLSNDERDQMQQHVTQSFRFLAEIPWSTTPWQNVAELAYGHHEHLDGTGYPRKLKGDQIVPQVRLMTIADVFDALTASDRPYKRAIPLEKALDILTKEFAERGKVDPLMLDVFIQKRVYDSITIA
ncbi:MAG TPA: HD domain-containing phosphohydrolase [Candidatus Baltobacteraceae bacterium]|nr:HD domain-containing phosphohydrolase [Candidatus Baltobacteraceae bacterium]